MPTRTSDDFPAQLAAARDVHVSNGNFANVTNGVVNFISTNNGDTEIPKELKSHSAPDALHTSTAVSRQNICTPGTRTATLNHLRSLAASSDPDSPDIVWMHGPAGAGKSAIMRTLAKNLEKDGLLLATFFFFHSESQRNTSAPFIPTLASQARAVLPPTQPHISEAIRRNQNIFSQPAHLQSPQLLQSPLLAALASTEAQDRWTKTGPLTVIVDGLDECTDLEGQTEVIKAMVELAASIRSCTDRRVKVFIASRPEHQIKTAFADLGFNKGVTVVPLDSSDANIHLFYDEQFDKIRKKFGLPSSWPSEEDMEWLTDKSSGQYSFAGVSTRFMHGGEPRLRLKILQEALQDDNLRPFETLDQLYATVFDQLPPEMRTPALLVIRCRLHPWWRRRWNDALEPLFQLPSGYVHGLAPYLSSLINFDDGLESYHASLADFLVNPDRSGAFSLHVADRTLWHAIQTGIIAAVVAEASSECLAIGQIRSLTGVLDQATDDNLMSPYPLPNKELYLLLRKVNVIRLTIKSSCLLFFFTVVLQKQFQFQYLFTTDPMLWYAIWFGLPHQLGIFWEQRTRAYSAIPQANVDLALFLPITAPNSMWSSNIWERLFLSLDERLPTADRVHGWNLTVDDEVEFEFNSMTLSMHLVWSNAQQVWRCMRAFISFVSDDDRLQTKHIYADAFKLLPSRHSYPRPVSSSAQLDPSCCEECAGALSRTVGRLLETLFFRNLYMIVSSKEIIATYHLARTSQRCWDSRDFIHELASLTWMYLEETKLPFVPLFIHNLWNRELQGVFEALEARRQDLGGKVGRNQHTSESSNSFAYAHQLRNTQIRRDLFIIITSSLVMCLCVLYMMF